MSEDHDPRVPAMTAQQARVALGVALCALDKIGRWEKGDDEKFGDPGMFARTAFIMATNPGMEQG